MVNLRVGIIGAGCAGLQAANDLQKAGHIVTVFDKGRTIGGRCATRPTPYGSVDHGVQHLNGNNALISQALEDHGVQTQQVNFQSGAYQPVAGKGPFLAPINGARSFAAALAQGLDVKPSHTVTRASLSGETWQLEGPDGPLGDFDAVILAIPPVQAAAFDLQNGAFDLEAADYTPQVAALIAHDEPLELPQTGPLEQAGLAWISVSADRKRATILSSEPLSSRLMETDKDEIASLLWQRIGGKGRPHYLKGHRWRYARVSTPIGKPCHWDAAQKLGYCGDWFLGPNVEHALESGAALAAAITP